MRCVLLVGLLSAASACTPPADPSDVAPQSETNRGFSDLVDSPWEPLGPGDPPLNVTFEDGSVAELFEGDILLTDEQQLDRKAQLNVTWPNGVVPYVITESSIEDREVILAAMEHWVEANACLQFVEKPENYKCGPHLRFVHDFGCWSFVGRRDDKSGQLVSIGAGCAHLGVVVHEIGHALGFWHEQSRPDRDAHVTVLLDNVRDGQQKNFRMRASADSLGVPYDLSSLMHYGGFGFTKNGMPTIITNEIIESSVMGQRLGLSHRDKELANLMYTCSRSPCPNPPPCINGGFVDQLCVCVCPPGTSGASCETITGTYYGTACGDQDITSPGIITSANYPALYPPGKHCVWIVNAPAGKRVRIQFGTARVLYRREDGQCGDWLTLHLDSDSMPDHVHCGSELQNKAFTSVSSRLALEFHSYRRSIPKLQTGFVADVTFTESV